MIKVSQQQRDNLLSALHVMWPSVPPENVWPDLGAWSTADSRPADCGTVACFGGWCANWPPFVDQGVYRLPSGMPAVQRGNSHGPAGWHLFGGPDMFGQRRGHHADKGFRGTDHELVTHRLQWFLANSEVA